MARLREALLGRTDAIRSALAASAKETLQYAIGRIRMDLAEGEADMAYRRSKEAYRRFGEDQTLVALLGRSCLFYGRYDEGIDVMSRLVNQRPDQILYRRTLAELHEAAGDLVASARHLSHAVTVSGNAVLASKLNRLRDRMPDRDALAMLQGA